jgi:hypothetical protein
VNNSTLLTGALVFAFILFLAARGRLDKYAAVVWGTSGNAAKSGVATSASGDPSTPNAVGSSVGSKPKTAGTMTATPSSAVDVLKNAYVQMGGGQAQQELSHALDLASKIEIPLALFGL